MTPKHRAPADQATLDEAARRAVAALRADDGRDADLPEGDDLPDDPEGHLVFGVDEDA